MRTLATWSEATGYTLYACGCCDGLSLVSPDGSTVVENIGWEDGELGGRLVRQPDEDQSLRSKTASWEPS